MNQFRFSYAISGLALCLFISDSLTAQQKKSVPPASTEQRINIRDSLLFQAAFKTCDITALGKILSSDFVFYQDHGQSANITRQPRKEFLDKIRESCDHKAKGEGIQMRREIVAGSLQVDQPAATEAIESGVQHFYTITKEGREELVEESRFSKTWYLQEGQWKLARELDYMINTSPELSAGKIPRFRPDPYTPVSKELYNTVYKLDSIYFDTYNTCNLDKMRSLMADSIEFYHDRGGLMTSIDEFMLSIKNNICGKVNRQGVPGSLEVYPIHNYGAVAIGYHRFFNNQEPQNGYSKPDKYVVIWRQDSKGWKITRVVSLH